jgi:LCP family protein required for cell wall assembly
MWPGLGQWYERRPRAAALYGIPVAVVTLALAFELAAGFERFALQLLDPSISLTVVVLMGLLGAWRVLSMVDAAIWIAGRDTFRGRSAAILAILVAAVLVTHAIAGYYAWAFYSAGRQIFVGATDGDSTPPPTSAVVATAGPSSSLHPATREPESPSPRITVLLTGIDSAQTRTHALTDTLLVISLEPETGDVAMISFPRDISHFELWDGRTFTGKINSLMTWVGNHPDEFPDGPLPSLMKELGYLLGIPIDYYAAVDLDGFRRMIDAVGGVTVNNPKRIADGRYDWLDGRTGFFLPAGPQTLDGDRALAFVRSRQGVGDNDFTRAARQQLLLLALREKLTDPSMLPTIPAILDAAAATIRTDFAPDRVGEMLDISRAIDDDTITRVILGPTKYATQPPTETTGGIYTLRLKMDEVARLSVSLFGDDSAYWVATNPAGSSAPAATRP